MTIRQRRLGLIVSHTSNKNKFSDSMKWEKDGVGTAKKTQVEKGFSRPWGGFHTYNLSTQKGEAESQFEASMGYIAGLGLKHTYTHIYMKMWEKGMSTLGSGCNWSKRLTLSGFCANEPGCSGEGEFGWKKKSQEWRRGKKP
jgi:hypothetical protein